MDGDDVFDDLLDATPFSFGRFLNWILFGALLAAGPAALVAGSGGTGEHFHPKLFAEIMVGAVVVIGMVAGLTDPRVRRRDGRERTRTHK